MNNHPNIFTRFGGRRFLMCLGCCVINTWLVKDGVIGDVVYQWLILGTVGAYITGNVGQKVLSAQVTTSEASRNDRQY